MIAKFKTTSILLSVAEDKIYDETTTFNEQNINEYLAEVEEYIKCLLTLMAKQLNFPHPILQALGLKDLPKKIEAAVIPKNDYEKLVDQDEDPDDATLNDMLDQTKFDSMVAKYMEDKKADASRTVAQSSPDDKPDESQRAERILSPQH